MLVDAEIDGELWLDGSFLTEKIDPKDIDIVLRINAEIYNSGDADTRAIIDWVIENQKLALHCDSYVLFQYDKNSPLHTEGQSLYSYWLSQWGISREGDPKGIAVLSLKDALS